MSVSATTPANGSTASEQPSSRAAWAKFLQQYLGIHAAGKAAQMQSFARSLRMAHDNAALTSPTSPAAGEEMIHVGDVINPPSVERPSAWPFIARVLGAGLIASGVAAPLGIAAWKLPEILAAMRPTAPVVQPQPPATAGDIWSQYELVVGPPKKDDPQQSTGTDPGPPRQ